MIEVQLAQRGPALRTRRRLLARSQSWLSGHPMAKSERYVGSLSTGSGRV